MRPKKRPVARLPLLGVTSKTAVGVVRGTRCGRSEGIVLTVEVVRIHQHHLDEAGLVKVECKAAAETGNNGHGVLEEPKLAAIGGSLRG